MIQNVKHVRDDFTQFLANTFKDETVRDRVKFLYTKVLVFPNTKVTGKDGKKIGVTERRIMSIKAMLESFSMEVFLKCVDVFIEKYNFGTSTKNTADAFKNYAKKVGSSYSQTSIVDTCHSWVPVRKEKLYDEYTGKFEFMNYSYRCKCGSTVNAGDSKCATCGLTLVWSGV